MNEMYPYLLVIDFKIGKIDILFTFTYLTLLQAQIGLYLLLNF